MSRKPERKHRVRRRGQPSRSNPWSLVALSHTVYVPLSAHGVVASNGGGAALGAVSFDPSSAGFASVEFATISSIYTQIKLISISFQAISSTDSSFETKTTEGCIAFAMSRNNSSAPSNIENVLDNGSWIGKNAAGNTSVQLPFVWNPATDKSCRGFRMFMDYPNLKYSITSTVATSNDTGCPGSIVFYGANLPASTTVFNYIISGVYAFRNKV